MTHLPIMLLPGIVVILVVCIIVRKRSLAFQASSVLIAALVVWGLSYVFMPSAVTTVDESIPAEDPFSSTPLFRAIKEKEPVVWEHLHKQMQVMHQQGQDEQAMIDAMQQQVLRLSVQRLQQAPDRQAVAYMKANMVQTAKLQKVSGDTCFRFLYPAVKGGINPVRLLPAEDISLRMQADVDMYNASFGADQHTVSAQEREQAHRDLRPILMQLQEQYGDDFALLATPEKAAGKEDKVCQMVQDLWQQVLALPEDKAAGIVRYSVAALQ